MDSTFFRIVVAISGLLLIAGLFLWDWLHKRALKKTEAVIREQRKKLFAGDEGALGDQVLVEAPKKGEGAEELELPSMNASRSDLEVTKVAELAPEVIEKLVPNVIQVSVVAVDTDGFTGDDLRSALEGLGLAQGDMGIYHRHFNPQNSDRFSVANLVEPGTFPDERSEPFSTPGVVIFLELSEQSDPLTVFDALMETAHGLARKLNGNLLNERHQPLEEEAVSELRKLLMAS